MQIKAWEKEAARSPGRFLVLPVAMASMMPVPMVVMPMPVPPWPAAEAKVDARARRVAIGLIVVPVRRPPAAAPAITDNAVSDRLRLQAGVDRCQVGDRQGLGRSGRNSDREHASDQSEFSFQHYKVSKCFVAATNQCEACYEVLRLPR